MNYHQFRFGSASRSSAGDVLKRSVDHTRRLGLFLVVLSGPLLGQVAGSGQGNRGLPAANVAISTPTSNKADDNSFIIGNDDVLAINVWKEPDFSRSLQVRSDGRFRCLFWEKFRQLG